MIRAIQDARKNMNLTPSEPIVLTISADEKIKNILTVYGDMITGPTLIKHISYVTDLQEDTMGNKIEIEGSTILFSVARH